MADHYPVARDLTPSRGEMYTNLMRVLGYLQQAPEAARNLVAGRGQDPNLGRWLMQLMISDPTGGPMPMAAPARIAYSTPKALELGQAGLRMLPERIRQFLLKHPNPVEVTSEPGLGKEAFFQPGRLGETPSVVLGEGVHPSGAAHEFMHAADYLRDPRMRTGVETAATPAGQEYGNFLMGHGYAQSLRPTETFAAPPFAIHNYDYAPARTAAHSLLQDPQSRNALLEALAQFTP